MWMPYFLDVSTMPRPFDDLYFWSYKIILKDHLHHEDIIDTVDGWIPAPVGNYG